MRILYAGTPDIAVPPLRAIAASHVVCGVLTNPARRSGRSTRLVQPPVHDAASELGIPVLQPDRLGSDARGRVTALAPQVMVVFAYGRIFGPRFLRLFPSGAINIHTSLLPSYRGPSPIQAALLAGDPVTGVTVQRIALEVDAGDILAQEEVRLSGDETAETLSPVLADKAAALVTHVLDDMEQGPIHGIPQDEEKATYCRLVTKEDGLIDWDRPATDIHHMYRAYTPWPGAWTTYDQTRLVIQGCRPVPPRDAEPPPGSVIGVDKAAGLLIQTGNGVLAVTQLQLQSKRSMDFRSFLNGNRNILAARLGDLS